MKFATIERTRDVVLGSPDLELLHTFRQFPVFMGCTDQPRSADILHDMSFWISRGSGMIQLNPLLPLDILYPEAHGAGCIGKLWKEHHQAFADFIAHTRPSSVLEIGGGHGILAAKYQKAQNVQWTILEPNPTPIADCRATIIKGFFDENFSYSGEVDAVVHSHVFEHIYEPDLFIRQLAEFLPEGKRLIFSIPNMKTMLERKYTNCLNFEHTIYISEEYVRKLLSRHGFEILETSYFREDHSIFFSAIRSAACTPFELEKKTYQTNRNLYLDYISYHDSLTKDLNNKINASRGPVYIFGAHVFSQYIIAFGLQTKKIAGVLDNDKNKQGRRLYGTDLKVDSPDVLAGLSAPAVILKAGVYNDEIRADILGNINASVIFLE